MTRYRPLPFRDRYSPASGTMVLPLGFDHQVWARTIDYVADRVSAPLCRGWCRDIIGELAIHAGGADALSTTLLPPESPFLQGRGGSLRHDR